MYSKLIVQTATDIIFKNDEISAGEKKFICACVIANDGNTISKKLRDFFEDGDDIRKRISWAKRNKNEITSFLANDSLKSLFISNMTTKDALKVCDAKIPSRTPQNNKKNVMSGVKYLASKIKVNEYGKNFSLSSDFSDIVKFVLTKKNCGTGEISIDGDHLKS